jgi:hypothetical protein
MITIIIKILLYDYLRILKEYSQAYHCVGTSRVGRSEDG